MLKRDNLLVCGAVAKRSSSSERIVKPGFTVSRKEARLEVEILPISFGHVPNFAEISIPVSIADNAV